MTNEEMKTRAAEINAALRPPVLEPVDRPEPPKLFGLSEAASKKATDAYQEQHDRYIAFIASLPANQLTSAMQTDLGKSLVSWLRGPRD